MQPLDGIKVLDFSTLLPGPLAGLVLAEAGAKVIKVERPLFGEEMRHWPPKWGNQAATFALLNAGKRSVALDLKDEEARARLKPLICEADVLIEQFRPGVMERLGLDYETVRQWNPRLIYCSITGYGQTGPKKNVAGHDLNYVSETGLLALSYGDPATPTLPSTLVADLAGGTYPAIVNILLALYGREKSGKGAMLDIAMTDNMFMLMSWALAQGAATGNWPKSGDSLLTGGSPRYHLYPASDGCLVATAAIEEKFWQTFCGLIGLSDELTNEKNPAPVISAVGDIIKTKTSDQWAGIFKGHDCCCSIVQSLGDALQDEHFIARGLFQRSVAGDDNTSMPALPLCVVPSFLDGDTLSKSAPKVGDLSPEDGFAKV